MSEVLLRTIMGAWIGHTVRKGMYGVVGTASRVGMYEVRYNTYCTVPGWSRVVAP